MEKDTCEYNYIHEYNYIDEYDEETGLPIDKSYLEADLPDFLAKPIEQLKKSWVKHDNGEFSDWDMDYCDVQSSINIAETENIITSEQAWYLREKYLRIQRP